MAPPARWSSPLGLAAEEGYRRPFVDGGAPVRSLLARHVQAGTGNLGDVGDLLEALARRARELQLL